MRKEKLIPICAAVTLLLLLLPTIGASTVKGAKSMYLQFRGFNLLEVSMLGLLPLLCPILTILTFLARKFKIWAKSYIAGIMSVLACVGWIGGTAAVRDFLIHTESISHYLIDYGLGFGFGIVLNLTMVVLAALPRKTTSQIIRRVYHA